MKAESDQGNEANTRGIYMFTITMIVIHAPQKAEGLYYDHCTILGTRKPAWIASTWTPDPPLVLELIRHVDEWPGSAR